MIESAEVLPHIEADDGIEEVAPVFGKIKEQDLPESFKQELHQRGLIKLDFKSLEPQTDFDPKELEKKYTKHQQLLEEGVAKFHKYVLSSDSPKEIGLLVKYLREDCGINFLPADFLSGIAQRALKYNKPDEYIGHLNAELGKDVTRNMLKSFDLDNKFITDFLQSGRITLPS